MSIEFRMKQAKSNSNRQNLEYRGVSNRSGIQIMEIRWKSEVTRGQVDNENNSQSQYSNISNIVQGGGLYIRV